MRTLAVFFTLALLWSSSASANKGTYCPAPSELAGVWKSSQGQVRMFSKDGNIVGDFKFGASEGFVWIKFQKGGSCDDVRATWRKKGDAREGTFSSHLDGNNITITFSLPGYPKETFYGRR